MNDSEAVPPAIDDAVTDADAKSRATTGCYVVLFAAPERPNEFVVAGEFAAGGQGEAKRLAVEAAPSDDVLVALAFDGGATMVAVPLASWKPTTAAYENPVPRLRV